MRKQYSKKDIKELINEFPYLEKIISKKSNVVEDGGIIRSDDEPVLIHKKIPHLKMLLKQIVLPKITVDMGAVKFVVSGADVMRPGITRIEEFKEEDLVVIVDENHGKPLAVGKALLSSEEMKNQKKGKSVKNLHYVGDGYWNI